MSIDDLPEQIRQQFLNPTAVPDSTIIYWVHFRNISNFKKCYLFLVGWDETSGKAIFDTLDFYPIRKIYHLALADIKRVEQRSVKYKPACLALAA